MFAFIQRVQMCVIEEMITHCYAGGGSLCMTHKMSYRPDDSEVDFKMPGSFYHLPTNNPFGDTIRSDLCDHYQQRDAIDWLLLMESTSRISAGTGGSFCLTPLAASSLEGNLDFGIAQLTPSARSTTSTQHQQGSNSKEVHQQ